MSQGDTVEAWRERLERTCGGCGCRRVDDAGVCGACGARKAAPTPECPACVDARLATWRSGECLPIAFFARSRDLCLAHRLELEARS